jgi:hypothetical protein
MKNIVAIAGAAILVGLVPTANAATSYQTRNAHIHHVTAGPKERVGTLSCQVAGGVGLLIGSDKGVSCLFRRGSGPAERYAGSIGKLGIDVGVTGKSYLTWVVYSRRATRAGEGALAGSYVGASAGAAVGVGVGANLLVGGNDRNFALQPLSGETGTGLNVAAGVSKLELRAVRHRA